MKIGKFKINIIWITTAFLLGGIFVASKVADLISNDHAKGAFGLGSFAALGLGVYFLVLWLNGDKTLQD